MLASITAPVSLLVAVFGTAVSGLAICCVGVASIFSRGAVFGVGVGAMLIGYGALVCWGAWAGYRRRSWSLGLMLAPALLHLATAASLFTGGDTGQHLIAGIAGAVALVVVVASVMPATRSAVGRASGPS
ncbi:MAG: hypothetical protein ACK5KO_01005 [Arachnia sp.]